MPTDETRLVNAIQTAWEGQVANTTDPAMARQQLATAIAKAVLIEIRAAQLLYNGGLVDGTGKPVTGIFNNTIN